MNSKQRFPSGVVVSSKRWDYFCLAAFSRHVVLVRAAGAAAGVHAGDSRVAAAVQARPAHYRAANMTLGWAVQLKNSAGPHVLAANYGNAAIGSTFPEAAIRAAIAEQSSAPARTMEGALKAIASANWPIDGLAVFFSLAAIAVAVAQQTLP